MTTPPTPLSLDEVNASFNDALISIKAARDSDSPFIIRYRTQIRLCETIINNYTRLLRSGEINSSFHAQQKNAVDGFISEIHQWANLEENHLMGQFNATYPHVHGEPIKINLGTLEFRSPSQSDLQFAVKFSNIRQQSNTEDPVREAWFCNFTGKDSHQRMLPLTMACTLRDKFIMITPKALGTDLFKYITADPQVARSNAKKIFSELCYSLDYLHNHMGVAHLDIKPENVFLDEHNLPIFGDFGMAHASDFPRHTHNNPQGFKFFFARHITTTIRETLTTKCIDEAPSSVLPPFSLNFPDFQRWHPHLLQRQNDPINLIDCVDSFSLGTIRDIPIPQPPESNSMVDGEQQQALLPPDPTILTYNDYLVFIAQQHADQFGVSLDEYWPQFDQSTVSRLDFFNYVMENTIAPLAQPVRDTHVQIHLLPHLPPQLYSLLTPDLSTLAVRPVTTTLGTRAYMAPEVFASNPNYDPCKADVYSLGVVFFILVFGFPPYRNSYRDQRHPEFDPAYQRLHMHYTEPAPAQNARNPGVTKLLGDYGKSGQVHQSVTDLLDRMMDFNFRTRISLKRIINEFLPRLQL